MARINQGIFKQIRDELKSLKTAYKQTRKDYFPDGEWNCNYDFFSDFSYEADLIYSDAISLANKIGGMLNATKFEINKNEDDFREMLSRAQDIAAGIKELFDDTLQLIAQSGGLTEIERETLETFQIYTNNY